MSDHDRSRPDAADPLDPAPGPDPGLPEVSALETDVEPPAELRARVVERLRSEGLLGPASGAPAGAPARRWLLAAAAVVVAFLAGRTTAPGSAGAPVGDAGAGAPAVSPAAAPEVADAQPRWALFLYEDGRMDIGGLTLDEVEAEYVAWAREAAAAGTLVLGEKLAEVEFVLASDAPPEERPLGVAPPPGILTGLFVVEAPSLEAAVEAARTTPHRAFGGTVLIRPIDPT